MSEGREISDYLDDIVIAIADVEEFTTALPLCRSVSQ